tara:strand:+ start:270 stop:440 length:171 start_codon:yes stop_codon:yes gene_type:complete
VREFAAGVIELAKLLYQSANGRRANARAARGKITANGVFMMTSPHQQTKDRGLEGL